MLSPARRRLLTGAGAWLPAPFVMWSAFRFIAGDRRWELVLLAVVVPLLAYGSVKSKHLFDGLYPIGLLGLVYDAMRFVKNVGLTPERVHVCDLREIDMRIASVEIDGVRVSVHDWLQSHASLAIDVLAAVPYGIFIYIVLAFAVFLYVKDYPRMRRFGWIFLLVNLAGFATYHAYPAAPPWYFHAHGCVVDLAAHASEGPNLARVDALLGVSYFASMYGRSSDVFGAVPSLHVAYPMLVVLFGWRLFGVTARAASLLFLASMCFAAVYLDHHWITDIIVGLAYTVAIYAALESLVRYRSKRAVSPFSPAVVS
jgi:hypothetical protein